MARFSAKKLNSSEINNGNEYTKDDRLSLEVLNGVVNSTLYSQELVDNIENKGEYLSTTTYRILNIVTYKGSSYIAIKDNFSGYAPTSTTYWKLIAEKGNTGEQGFTPEIKIGTVTGVANNQNPSVTNVGTPTAPILNFGIPNVGTVTNTYTESLYVVYYTGNTSTSEIPATAYVTTYSSPSGGQYRIISCDLTSIIEDFYIFSTKSVISVYGLFQGKKATPFLTNIVDLANSKNPAPNDFSISYIQSSATTNIYATTSASRRYGFKLLLFVKD